MMQPMNEPAANPTTVIDFRPVKRAAAERYRPDHPLRRVIEMEPDVVPRTEAAVLIVELLRLTMRLAP
ncbi:MAG: hypothetical protein V4510_04700 [bacterium]